MTARRVSLEALPGDVGERVDKVVAARLEADGVSRSAVSRLCDEGRVVVRSSPAKASQRVRAGDVIEVEIPAPAPIEAKAEDIPLAVVYEDRDLLVVDKPAGLVVHPAKGHPTGTLVNAVLHHAEVDDDDADPLRPGIVHRIDRYTSGLLVVALTPVAREALMARFRAHDIERSYVALCEGVPGAVTFDTFYDRHPTDRLRFSSRVVEGRRAVTHVRTLEPLAEGRAAYVRCTAGDGADASRSRRPHGRRGAAVAAGRRGDAVYGRRPSGRAGAGGGRGAGATGAPRRGAGLRAPGDGQAGCASKPRRRRISSGRWRPCARSAEGACAAGAPRA